MGMTTRKTPPTEILKDASGRWRTKSLFMETNEHEDKYPSIFTLEDSDKEGRISMRSIYLSTNDPTEYAAAKAIFGSLDCWNSLCKAPFFKRHLENWRGEMQRRIKSQAVKAITDIAEGGKGTASQLGAAKWIASQEWNGPELVTKQRGRPLKQRDPMEALREGLLDAEETNEDWERLHPTSDDEGKGGS